MFTYFTIGTASASSKHLPESGFDTLSRTCHFMLAEEAHHAFTQKIEANLLYDLYRDRISAGLVVLARNNKSMRRYLSFLTVFLYRTILDSIFSKQIHRFPYYSVKNCSKYVYSLNP